MRSTGSLATLMNRTVTRSAYHCSSASRGQSPRSVAATPLADLPDDVVAVQHSLGAHCAYTKAAKREAQEQTKIMREHVRAAQRSAGATSEGRR